MSKVGLWSVTPGNNNSTPPDGWPEGQAPSTVNDCAREMMAQIRAYINDVQYVDLGNTPSFLTATTFSMQTADATNFAVGRRVKLFDNTTLYGTIDSVSATFVSVRLDSGALTASLSSVALSVLTPQNNALPGFALRRRNILINGNMDIWQRGATFAPANNATTYTADRFCWAQSASCIVNIQRAERSANTANVPTLAQAGLYLANSLRVSVGTIDAAFAAGEYAILSYRVEGHDWQQIAHKPNILSFWVSSNKSGIFATSIRNSPASASYVQNFTISAVNTWSRFSMTIPEAPTSVTWNYSESTGCEIAFCFGGGSTYQGGAGNWTAANILCTASQTNFCISAGNAMMITGVQFEEGTQATPLEIKQYADEVARCQRYYWRGLPCTAFNFGAFTATQTQSWPVRFPQTMRIVPTVAISCPGVTVVALQGAPVVNGAFYDGCRMICTANGANANANILFASTDFIEADADM